jgi:hypothetical protein
MGGREDLEIPRTAARSEVLMLKQSRLRSNSQAQ